MIMYMVTPWFFLIRSPVPNLVYVLIFNLMTTRSSEATCIFEVYINRVNLYQHAPTYTAIISYLFVHKNKEWYSLFLPL